MSDETKTILLYEPIAEEGKNQDVLAGGRRPSTTRSLDCSTTPRTWSTRCSMK
jgi:hypothetical protein